MVDGTVNGILIVSAGEAEINGTVNGDLIMFVSQAEINGRTIWPLVLGIVLYGIITSIPCLGHVIGFIVALTGLGAIWLLIRQGRSAPKPVPEEAPTAEG